MTLRRYIVLMFSSTMLSWFAWIVILFRVDPFVAGFWGFALFYLTLFFSLTGTYALLGLLIRVLILKNEVMFRLVLTSFRQAISYAFLMIVALFLKSQGLLNWLNIIILILILAFIEYMYMVRSKRYLEENNEETA